MPLRDVLLAVLATAVWGVAFVAIQLSVNELPPLFVTGARYFLAAVPAVLFVPRPKVSWAWLALYGVMQGAVMFGSIFVAIAMGMPPGLASLVVQSQVFFTILFSALAFGDRPGRPQVVGTLVAAVGLVVIAVAKAQSAPLLPFLLVVFCAAAWGVANIVSKAAKPDHMLGFIVWSSPFPVPVLLAASALFEPGFANAITHVPSMAVILSILFMAYAATLLTFGIWVGLLKRHPAAEVMPFALLIPVFGFGSTALVFGETISPSIGVGAAIVFAGLAIVLLAPRLSGGGRLK